MSEPQPNTPSWAQQPQGTFGPPLPPADVDPASKTKSKDDKKATCLGCGCLSVVALLIIGGIGALVGGGDSHSTVAAKPSATTSTTAPARAATHAAASSAPKATSTPTQAAAQCGASSPAAARAKAAKILHANNAYYQKEFNDGVTVVLARGSDNSFQAFHAWYEKAATDVKPGMDAFKNADACFTADDEPASISDWRDDNGNLTADVAQLANDGLDVGGPDDTAARQKVQADISNMPHDFDAAEADADKVAAGK